MTENQPKSAISARAIVIIVAVVVALAAGIALLSGGDDTAAPSSKNTVVGGVAAAEYQDVKAEGTALEPLEKGGTDAALGLTAPSLTGHSFSGFPISVNPGRDTAPTMLVFLAHWCPHCNAEMPRLVSWYENGLVPDDLRVIGVATGSRKGQANWPPSRWVESFDWPFEVLADSASNDAASAYGVNGYPFIVILDASGKVVARHSGELGEGEIPAFVNGALGR